MLFNNQLAKFSKCNKQLWQAHQGLEHSTNILHLVHTLPTSCPTSQIPYKRTLLSSHRLAIEVREAKGGVQGHATDKRQRLTLNSDLAATPFVFLWLVVYKVDWGNDKA